MSRREPEMPQKVSVPQRDEEMEKMLRRQMDQPVSRTNAATFFEIWESLAKKGLTETEGEQRIGRRIDLE